MYHYILVCLDIFLVVLECLVIAFIVQSFLPLGPRLRMFFLMLVSPILFPMQKIVKRSIMNTFSVDLSPYFLIVVLSYLEKVCVYLLNTPV